MLHGMAKNRKTKHMPLVHSSAPHTQEKKKPDKIQIGASKALSCWDFPESPVVKNARSNAGDQSLHQ